MASRHEVEIPGLLSLEKAWDALDVILSARGENEVLGDAVLGRSGRKLGDDSSFGPPRILDAAQVERVSKALQKLPRDTVRKRYADLHGRSIQGDYGQKRCAPGDPDSVQLKVRKIQSGEISELEDLLVRVTDLYKGAADSGHAMMCVVVS